MKRADRLEPVQRIVDDTEKRMAEHLASAERLVKTCEQKLSELNGYRDDYTQGFEQRAGNGMGARDLLDYQAFISRLNDAINQQAQIVENARQECELHRLRWQDAAKRAKALGHVIHTWQQEERRSEDRREQRETDERAQRRAPDPI